MTTARTAARPAGPRHSRRPDRRRVLREELLAVLVLAALFAVTVLLLCVQWLGPGSGTSFGHHGGHMSASLTAPEAR